jgi:hypothetical protein
MENYGIWAWRMKSVLERDGLFVYCTTPARENMTEVEKRGRTQALSVLNGSAKNTAYKLMKRYRDPHTCWTQLKDRYEAESNPRKLMLIKRFFGIKKTSSISMDDYLTNIKEAADMLEELGIPLPEPIVVYYIVDNLPKEYDIQKQMILSRDNLPGYLELESKLLAEEMSRKTDQKNDGEALAAYSGNNSRRPYNRGFATNQGGRWNANSHGRGVGQYYQNSNPNYGSSNQTFNTGSTGFSNAPRFNSGNQSYQRYDRSHPNPANYSNYSRGDRYYHQGPPERYQGPPERHQGPPERQSSDRNKSDNLVTEIRMMMERMKELEGRLSDHRKRNSGPQIQCR